MSTCTLEACVGNVADGRLVSHLGVDRLEFCANLEIGGTTPSLASFPLLKDGCAPACKINVLIRPRGGDFLYCDLEFETLLAEIAQFKALGADGFVFGFLTKEGALDGEKMQQAIAAAGGLPCTLHRAFDMCKDPFATLDLAASLGVHTILTSGQAPDALAGMAMLQKLQAYSAGRVSIMACGGIKAEKITPIYQQTGVHTYHMAGLRLCESEMQYRNEALSMGSTAFDEYTLRRTDLALIAQAVQVRDGLAFRAPIHS